MKVVEYRLVLPLTTEEYHLAQLYMVSKASREETGGGEGVEIVKNQPYIDNPHKLPPGQYTEKIFHLRSKVPSFIAAIIPASAMSLVEYSWNAFPKCLTVYEHTYSGEKFHLSVETMHLDDNGHNPNANNLSPEELKVRHVEMLNIADKANGVAMVKGEDPTVFHSKKTGRGPLDKNFAYNSQPIMCAYKVVRLNFKVFGLQKKVEDWGHRYGIRNPFIHYHRKLFCWIDEWYGLTLEDIRAMEVDTQRITMNKLHEEVKEEEPGASSSDSKSVIAATAC
mmetsp:Transcript_6335/g.11436  ORF Transcript_6335/g.11436 Transcript_6335/m.11436 type:complete len:280 (+) Transcript_6335:505-1344(+)|eukprot:CAMPEP_0184697826 /NCGR_PEP_ID=MMETSP0313-20130426/4649_1 /TAXON_ID=2792 /ORGANISM="Porphyridium aerugineum, Strain SAG 1380-2" /LENGTH=279 /DNA_ID=CAMNT_0027156663 /DNA_START=465 /DNA_END=1304 /DNA_ORIENTATION=-